MPTIRPQPHQQPYQALPLQLSLFPVSMNTLLQQKQICTPQNNNTNKILPDSKKSVRNTSSSQINMTNIDEKEEIQSPSQKNEAPEAPQSPHATSAAHQEASRIANVHQCSNLSNYNMQTFFTPSQASKKNVNKNFDYFALPTHLFPHLNKTELYKSAQLNKQRIELETLRLLNGQDSQTLQIPPMIDQGIVQNYEQFEEIINLAVNKMVIDPYILAT